MNRGAPTAAKTGVKPTPYGPIPYAAEQGIFCGLARNLNRRSGKFPPSSGNPDLVRYLGRADRRFGELRLNQSGVAPSLRRAARPPASGRAIPWPDLPASGDRAGQIYPLTCRMIFVHRSTIGSTVSAFSGGNIGTTRVTLNSLRRFTRSALP